MHVLRTYRAMLLEGYIRGTAALVAALHPQLCTKDNLISSLFVFSSDYWSNGQGWPNDPF